MVFFTCSHCGESVKKPAVAKHYQSKCGKKEPFLTCIDCLKDFKGNEYEAHTKCVTEEQRYSAKGSARKQTLNRGERKQRAWQESMQAVLKKPTLKADERDLIRAISKYENVPRKKAKFINFLSNAFKQYASKTELIDRVWNEMESVFKEMTGRTNQEQEQKQQAQAKQQQQQQQQQQQKPQKQESKNAPKKSTPKPEEGAPKKEKKRKRQAEEDKVVEGGDSGKSEENQKKKKQKQSEEKPAVGNDDALMSDDRESKQEKKNRKRKADEDDQTEQNDSVPDEAEPGKKKKKKKVDKPTENQVTETPAQKPEEESKNKKKNKKPKPEGEQTKVNNAPTGAGDSVAVKKEKKAKKSENKENEKAPVKNAAPGNAQGEAEKPAAKKKKPAAKAESGGEENKQEMQFDWKATILQVLNQDGKNNRIQLQKLQKKVLKLHCQVMNCELSEKKEKRFMKKLNEMSEVVLDKDFVVLKS